jgi:hypothetical protein
MSMSTSDFKDYVETTYDPGWSWTVLITTLSVMVNLSIPLFVRLGQRWDQRQVRQQKQQSIKWKEDHGGDNGGGDSVSGDKKQDGTQEEDEASSSVSSDNKNKQDTTTKNNIIVVDEDSLSSSMGSSAIASDMASSVVDAGMRTKRGRKHIRMQKRENERLQKDPSPDFAFDDISFDDSIAKKTEINNDNPSRIMEQNNFSEQGVFLPWYQYSFSNALIDAADWDKEMKKVWYLAKPFTIEAFCESIFATAIVGIIGHFIGVREASAYVVATIMIEFTATINYGFPEALESLGSQALGADKEKLLGQYIQLGAVLYAIGCIPIVILWAFFAEECILWLGFDAETARIGQGYMVAYSIVETIEGVEDCLHAYLDITDHEWFSLAFSLAGYTSELLLFLLMGIFGEHDLIKIGIIQCFMQLFTFLLMFAVVSYKGWIEDDVFEGAFKTNAFKVSYYVSISSYICSCRWL